MNAEPSENNFPGLVGLLSDDLRLNIADSITGMQNALGTSLTFSTACGEHFACASTGDTSSSKSNLFAAAVGTPEWTTEDLKQIAQQSGDAQAFITAYRNDGSCFTDSVRGHFSFILFDTINQHLMAGVDRFASYPLYYFQDQDRIIIASNPDALLQENSISPQGIYNYVYYHMVPSPGSIYSGIKKLAAATALEYTNGAINTRRYWKPLFRETVNAELRDLGDELKVQLKAAVKRKVGSEESVAAFLSGGLDSSTVVGMLSEISPSPAEAYSIGFSAKGYDEMAYARITAQHFGVKLHEYYVTPADVVSALPKIAASFPEPFGNSSALPAWFCAKQAARNGVKLLLAGDGGDEIFAGNERYSRQKVFELYRKIPPVLRKNLIQPLIGILPEGFTLVDKANSYLEQAITPLPDRLQSYNFLHRYSPEDVFQAEYLADVSVNTPLELLREVYSDPTDASSLNRMLYLDWQFTLADNDLRKVSHMCAKAGVAVAYPLLDDNLLEFSTKIPSRWKIQGQNLRHFYKSALTGWLPESTIHKEKHGFGLPFGIWMREYKPLQELAYDSLQHLRKRSYFKREFIDQAISLHRDSHSAYYGELIWILMILELWLQAATHTIEND